MQSRFVSAFSISIIALTLHLSAQNNASGSWDARCRAIPDAANIGEYMKRLSARPHHVGSPYDKENAEWILAKFKEWGWDAQLESFTVLFPTPKERIVELVAPTQFKALLEEPAIAIDPTSSQKNEQLPPFNAYSIDGDVTAPLVYVNYGRPQDYESPGAPDLVRRRATAAGGAQGSRGSLGLARRAGADISHRSRSRARASESGVELRSEANLQRDCEDSGVGVSG